MAEYHQFRQQLEDHWRDRVKLARLNYDFAVAQCRSVLDEQEKWPLPAPDGSTAVRKAHAKESDARNEYMRVLRIFTDLTVHGKIPKQG